MELARWGAVNWLGAMSTSDPGASLCGLYSSALRAQERLDKKPAGHFLKLHDPSNTERELRLRRQIIGFPKITTHSLRKTVATALDQSGMSARAIAEYLGHKNPSMTQDKYMAQNTGGKNAAKSLDVIFTDLQ